MHEQALKCRVDAPDANTPATLREIFKAFETIKEENLKLKGIF